MVRHATHTVQLPAIAGLCERVRPPLAELFVECAAHLEQRRALLVHVGIDRDRRAGRRPSVTRLAVVARQLTRRDAERTDDALIGAARMTLEQDAPLVPLAHGETRVPVLVRRAAG